MPDNWLTEVDKLFRDRSDMDIASSALAYIAEVGRGPAFLAWLRAQRDKEELARG